MVPNYLTQNVCCTHECRQDTKQVHVIHATILFRNEDCTRLGVCGFFFNENTPKKQQKRSFLMLFSKNTVTDECLEGYLFEQFLHIQFILLPDKQTIFAFGN